MKRALRIGLCCTALCLGGWSAVASAAPADGPKSVIVVPIEGVVDEGMAHLVDRAVDEANASGQALVLDMNTPGGLLDSGFAIRDALFRAKVPTIAYISRRAFSAGALIALAARKIDMAPGASIGAAEPISTGPDQSHQAKFVSAVAAEFRSTAGRNHRDPKLAAAMVDKSIDVPRWKHAGAILSLTADEAVQAGIADAVSPSLDDALRANGLAGAATHVAAYTFAERVARFATSPEVSGLLLSLGLLGLLIEMQTLHAIAGIIGVSALALFFGTHVYSGFSDGFVIGLAILGLIGIAFELHVVPGHGIAGTLGIVALGAAVFLAFGLAFTFVALQAISIAIVLTVIVFWLALRVFPENAFAKRIALSATQGPEYVASADFSDLVGRTGVASSFLRPAGVATVGGRRIDVLTEGDFVEAGSFVRVNRVEGSRIFVDPVEKEL